LFIILGIIVYIIFCNKYVDSLISQTVTQFLPLLLSKLKLQTNGSSINDHMLLVSNPSPYCDVIDGQPILYQSNISNRYHRYLYSSFYSKFHPAVCVYFLSCVLRFVQTKIYLWGLLIERPNWDGREREAFDCNLNTENPEKRMNVRADVTSLK